MKTYTVKKDCFIHGAMHLAGGSVRLELGQAVPFLRGGQIEEASKPKPKAKSED